MVKRAVIKFGGSDLANTKRVKKAAEMVIDSDYEEIIVVVSAMGKTTDVLVDLSDRLEVTEKNYAEIVSMGEKTSAKIFSNTLEDLGAKSICIDTENDLWPIYTDNNYIDAEPDLESTNKAVQENISPMVHETIPVICGFIGKNFEEEITTLGRGGSDTTALLIGNCVDADEVILVKDTKGILSCDPNLLEDCRTIDRIDIEEVFALAHGGAEIIRYKALKYKLPDQRLRIIPFSSKCLTERGTEVSGVFSDEELLNYCTGLSSITVVGDIGVTNIFKLFDVMDDGIDIELNGISTGERSLTIFGTFDLNVLVEKFHDIKAFKAVSTRNEIGMIDITHPKFVDNPGWVAKITETLSNVGINIIEVTTSKATVNIFINDYNMERAVQILKSVFKERNEELAIKDKQRGDLVEI